MVRRAAWGVLVTVLVSVPLSVLASLPAPGVAAQPVPDVEQVDLGGTRVDVSTDAGDPTELTAGLWADTLTGPGAVDGNVHRFSYRRTMRDSTVLVGLVATSTQVSDGVELVVEGGGTPCGADTATSRSTVLGGTFGVLVVAGSDTLGDRNDECVTAETLDIAVSRTADLEGELPVAIRVVEEAPAVTSADLADPVEEPTVRPPQPSEPRPLDGAASFEDAPGLDAGGTVATEVTEGSERLYRVRLDWGQALAARVDVASQDSLEGVTPTVELTLLDPLRNPFDSGHDEVVDSGYLGAEGARLFDGTLPVVFAHRYDDGLLAVPGDYWVSVAVSPPPEDRAAVDVPVEITVDVVGDASGAPEFEGTVQSPGTGPGPEGYRSETPYLVDTDTFSADVSGTPRVPEAAGADDGVRRTAGLVVGAASLLSVLLGVVLLLRRGRVRAG